MTVNALAGNPLPVHGDGDQNREGLYVDDHCSGIRWVLAGNLQDGLRRDPPAPSSA